MVFVMCIVMLLNVYMFYGIYLEYQERSYRVERMESKHDSPDEFFVDPRVNAALDEFVKDAKSHGYDLDRLYEIDEITIEKFDVNDSLHGVCQWYLCDIGHLHGNIKISEKLYKSDKFGFRSVLYHELGHWFGHQHTFCDEKLIMHWAYDQTMSDSLVHKWEESKEIFFNKPDYEQQLVDCDCFKRL